MEYEDYYEEVDLYVFESWIDIPYIDEYMSKIIISQFYNHNVPIDYCKKFTTLVLKIGLYGQKEYKLTYEPFKKLYTTFSVDENWEYVFEKSLDYENLYFTLQNDLIVTYNYKDDLSYDKLIEKLDWLSK